MQTALRRFLAHTSLRLMVGAALLPATVPAAAQGGPPPPFPGPGLARACEDREALLAARLAFLETKIAPTADQRGAWNDFVGALHAAEQPLRDLCAQPPAPPKLDDPLAMLEAQDRVVGAHAAAWQAAHIAIAHLKDKLPPDQQRRLAAALLSPAGHRRPGFLGGGLWGAAPPGPPPGQPPHGPGPFH